MDSKRVRMTSEDKDEDRISSLSDDLIHKILSFLDMKLAIQTSGLSKRWNHIWTTLPFLNFEWYEMTNLIPYKLITHVIDKRNHECQIFNLKVFSIYNIRDYTLEQLIEYAILHNVEDLNISLKNNLGKFKYSIFSSNTIEKLVLKLNLEESDQVFDLNCWDLPYLTTLNLHPKLRSPNYKLPESCLICLPALTTLSLNYCDLPEPFSLPALITLNLACCKLPQTVWDLPALLSLELDDVAFPENISEFFSALVSLQNLALFFETKTLTDCLISCPQLVNLDICTSMDRDNTVTGNIVVMAPELCTLSCFGIFPITCGVSKLETVYINLFECIEERNWLPLEKMKQYYSRFTLMFPGLSTAKFLTLDLDAIEALSAIADLLACLPSPFYNLKCVMLPHGYKESSVSGVVLRYLLGGSPGAAIATTLMQNDVIPRTAPVLPTAPKVVLEELRENLSKDLADSQNIHKKERIDTVETRMEEEHVIENYGVDAGKVIQVGACVQGCGGLLPNAPVAGAGNDRASSSRGNHDVVWQGHEVKSEFVGLLDLIMKKYPETFEQFTTKSKLCTIKLNMFCIGVNGFIKTLMTDVDTEMLTEFRSLFFDLQRWGFNVNWLVSRLNYIEQLRLSQPLVNELDAIDPRIDDAKSKLQDLKTLGMEKMTDSESFRTTDTSLPVNYIGDDLFLISNSLKL